jgi:Domain of unknown function (DUF4832)/Domain of unknown function (DUF4874)
MHPVTCSRYWRPAIFLLFIFLMGCQPASTSPEPASVAHTYVTSDASILNPERGFFTPYELPGTAGFSPVRATGNTLVHLNIRLDEWREADIPQNVLDGLQTNFDDIREAGIKAIIRFAYNQGPYPDSEPDASKAQILRHIEQLTPLLQTNSDVIAWLEAGFIGAWGEWHTSTNGLDNLTDKRDILNALITAVPNRYVQVRYPANIIDMFPNPDEAATARVAHHNDCFLSSDTDVGTYERDSVITIDRDKAYLSELTRFTPMSGETCAPNPPRSECKSALPEMALLHFSAINEAYHKGILRSWEQGGCMEEINNRMGYRLSLTSADFNEKVRPGGILNLSVNLQNTGFASIINERHLYVILVGRDDIPPYKVKLDMDPRTWEPGTATFTIKLRIPSNISAGAYQLALWLPDGYASLQDNPLYAIRFANENVFDPSTGYNVLGAINVNQAAGGSYQSGTKFQVIESSSSVERNVQSIELIAVETHPAPAVGALITNPQISNDSEHVHLSFDYVSGTYNAFQLFIDEDQNPKTGYQINGIGAETLFENHTWNLYNGSGADWNWSPTELLIQFEDSGSQARWTVSRNVLHSSKFDLVFQLVDANWNTASVTGKIPYTLK